MIKKQRNKKKIYSKKRVLRGGLNTDATFNYDGLHSILTDTQTILPDGVKKKILTEPICSDWFTKIRNHQNYAFLTNPVTKKLKRNVKGELENATPNARSAVKFCEDKYRLKLDGDERDGLVVGVIPSVNSSSGAYEGIGSTSTPLPPDPEPLPPDSESLRGYIEQEEEVKPGQEITTTTPEEESLDIQTNITLSELRHLLIVASDNKVNYCLRCKNYLDEIFFEERRVLFESINQSQQRDKKKLYEDITALFKYLEFSIIRPDAVTQGVIQGLFIGIKKQKPKLKKLGIFSVNYTCEAFKLFDLFVNTFMDRINYNDNETLIEYPGKNKKLFLFLMGGDESYKKAIESCNIDKAKLYSDKLDAMIKAGLPRIGLEQLIESNYTSIQHTPLQVLEEGGSKSRRRHPRHRKPVRKTRRGCKSKSKTHRRGSIRKNKKYTRKR